MHSSQTGSHSCTTGQRWKSCTARNRPTIQVTYAFVEWGTYSSCKRGLTAQDPSVGLRSTGDPSDQPEQFQEVKGTVIQSVLPMPVPFCPWSTNDTGAIPVIGGLRSLNPEPGKCLLMVCGRLTTSLLSCQAKQSIILPAPHHVIHLSLMPKHAMEGHAWKSHMLSTM